MKQGLRLRGIRQICPSYVDPLVDSISTVPGLEEKMQAAEVLEILQIIASIAQALQMCPSLS